ncbi:hypothetical protein B0H14DRAFT_1119526 [Mycena olivaceomarginata]|nr:hypothetical protein B0H14DRAFT_1119526 [Mycena olivaceomarginata]
MKPCVRKWAFWAGVRGGGGVGGWGGVGHACCVVVVRKEGRKEGAGPRGLIGGELPALKTALVQIYRDGGYLSHSPDRLISSGLIMRTRRLYSVLGSGAETESFVLGKCSGTPPHFAQPFGLTKPYHYCALPRARTSPRRRTRAFTSTAPLMELGERHDRRAAGSSCGDFFRADAMLAGCQSLCVALESKSE